MTYTDKVLVQLTKNSKLNVSSHLPGEWNVWKSFGKQQTMTQEITQTTRTHKGACCSLMGFQLTETTAKERLHNYYSQAKGQSNPKMFTNISF